MKIILVNLFLLCAFNVVNAQNVAIKNDLTPPEYRQVMEVLKLPDKAITIARIDIIMTNALMETNRVWETNIFGQIRHGLNRENIKYSIIHYLALQFAEVFFHPNDIFTYKGQGFSITDNTRNLALESFWDFANTQLETKHVFDIIEKKMFEITMLSLSENPNNLEKAKKFLKHSSKYITNNSNNAHFELFALSIKNQLFNIYSGTDSAKVRSAAFSIINTVIKKGTSTPLTSNEYKMTLKDFSKTFSVLSCKAMWN